MRSDLVYCPPSRLLNPSQGYVEIGPDQAFFFSSSDCISDIPESGNCFGPEKGGRHGPIIPRRGMGTRNPETFAAPLRVGAVGAGVSEVFHPSEEARP